MYLVKKDATHQIRVVEINLVNSGEQMYAIYRKTGLLNGVMTEQPFTFIVEGKASRTVKQQAELEFNSFVNSYLDKGYKYLSNYGIETLDQIDDNVKNIILSEIVTDANGNLKHMLAKQPYSFASDLSQASLIMNLGPNDKRFKAHNFGSFKINGVRSSIFYVASENKIRTASRGGKEFNAAMYKFINSKALLATFKMFPHIVLDGEIYTHGYPPEKISGLTRLRMYNPKVHDALDFYIFDTMQRSTEFRVRKEMVKRFVGELEKMAILYDEEWLIDKLFVVEHEDLFSFDDVMELHDRAVEEGYEGAIIRDPHATYGYGVRDSRMIKIKLFDDAEFMIVGSTPGKRKEDLVFVLQLPNGKTFEAKPAGKREVREHYADNASLYYGLKATVKFFGYSRYGVPNLPTLIVIHN